MQVYKVHQPHSPSSTLFVHPPSPQVYVLEQDLLTFLSFISKCILIVQRGFTIVWYKIFLQRKFQAQTDVRVSEFYSTLRESSFSPTWISQLTQNKRLLSHTFQDTAGSRCETLKEDNSKQVMYRKWTGHSTILGLFQVFMDRLALWKSIVIIWKMKTTKGLIHIIVSVRTKEFRTKFNSHSLVHSANYCWKKKQPFFVE
jgi:hypothetical protein